MCTVKVLKPVTLPSADASGSEPVFSYLKLDEE